MINKYMKLERIEFFVTDICSAKCKHCSVQNKTSTDKHIDKIIAVDIIKRLREIYDIRSVMTFGGEPLLYPGVTCSIHKTATDIGIPHRQVITNGYWTKDLKKIEEIAYNLGNSGVNKVLISVDAFHQEYIPIEIVVKAARELQKTPIEVIKWSPCWVGSEKDNNPYNVKTRQILKELESLALEIGNGNVVHPEGGALENLEKYLPSKQAFPKGKCGEIPYTDPLDSIKSISIEPNGDVVVCKGFIIGNANEKSIVDIVSNYNPYDDQYMKSILEEGMEGLVKIANDKGIKIDSNGFYSICDMCMFIRDKCDSL